MVSGSCWIKDNFFENHHNMKYFEMYMYFDWTTKLFSFLKGISSSRYKYSLEKQLYFCLHNYRIFSHKDGMHTVNTRQSLQSNAVCFVFVVFECGERLLKQDLIQRILTIVIGFCLCVSRCYLPLHAPFITFINSWSGNKLLHFCPCFIVYV